MITLSRRGKIYWATHCENGARTRWSLKTRSEKTARELLRNLEIELLTGGRLKRISWPEFEKEFFSWIEHQVRPSTIRGYRIAIERLGRFINSQSAAALVSEITPTTMAAYMEERSKDVHPSTKRTLSRGGLRFDLRVIRRAFSYAIDCGYIATNPVRVRNLNSESGRTLPFTQDEVAKMLGDSLLSIQMRAIVLTFLHTGMRLSDVMAIEKTAVSGDFLVRQTIKRQKVVALPIHTDLRAAIKAHLLRQNEKQRRSALLFTTSEGKPIRSIARDLKALFTRCKIAGGHAHRFRDTFAVRLLAKGASLYDVAKLLGVGVGVAEMHYAPYVKELQDRGIALMEQLSFAAKCG